MSDNKNQDPNKDHGHQDEHEHYVQPIAIYIRVFVGLIILTGLTVATSMFDFGIMNIVIAMIIAVCKALLVVVFFMQLKYDDIGNRVTFAASFAFLAIFILLTSSDLFFRKHPAPVKVEQSNTGGETDQNKLRIATPALVAKGKEIFAVQCVSCHGTNGYGDGPAAVALNPKPRNYHSGFWRYGGTPTQLFHTLTVGSPGTAMASFASLSIEERYALAHYVRTMAPNPPDDTPATLKTAGLLGGSKANAAEVPDVQIPIDMAMEKLEEPYPDQVAFAPPQEFKPFSLGAHIYDQKCASCHGVNGVGVRDLALGQNPQVILITNSWAGSKAPWVFSSGVFTQLVTEGLVGQGMPGMADFSREEMGALYSYVRELTQLQ